MDKKRLLILGDPAFDPAALRSNRPAALDDFMVKYAQLPLEAASQKAMWQALNKAVETFSPDIILLHIGQTFHNDPEAVINALVMFKEQQKALKIVADAAVPDHTFGRIPEEQQRLEAILGWLNPDFRPEEPPPAPVVMPIPATKISKVDEEPLPPLEVFSPDRRVILVLDSIDDPITRRKIRYQKENPALSYNYAMDYCHIINRFVEDADESDQNESTDTVTYEDLLQRVESKIASNKPDFLLVHLGMGFRRWPDIVTRVLMEIHQKYPHIRIGSDRKGDPNIFEYSEEMDRICELVFGFSPRWFP